MGTSRTTVEQVDRVELSSVEREVVCRLLGGLSNRARPEQGTAHSVVAGAHRTQIHRCLI